MYKNTNFILIHKNIMLMCLTNIKIYIKACINVNMWINIVNKINRIK